MGIKHLHLAEKVFIFWINLVLGRSQRDVLKMSVVENWYITIRNWVKQQFLVIEVTCEEEKFIKRKENCLKLT